MISDRKHQTIILFIELRCRQYASKSSAISIPYWISSVMLSFQILWIFSMRSLSSLVLLAIRSSLTFSFSKWVFGLPPTNLLILENIFGFLLAALQNPEVGLFRSDDASEQKEEFKGSISLVSPTDIGRSPILENFLSEDRFSSQRLLLLGVSILSLPLKWHCPSTRCSSGCRTCTLHSVDVSDLSR